MMTTRYDLTKIRTLLTEGFSEEELRNLCFENPIFQPLSSELAENSSRKQIATQLLKYAERKKKIDDLLAWAKENNDARYKLYGPYVEVQLTPLPVSKFWQSRLWLGGGALVALSIVIGIGAWFRLPSPSTLTSTSRPSDTPLPVVTSTPTNPPTFIPTSVPTDTPNPPTSASLPASISTDTPTSTLTPTLTSTQVATPVPDTPTSTLTLTPTATQAATPVPDTPTSTPTPTQAIAVAPPPPPPSPTITSTPTIPTGQIVLLKPSSLDGPSSGPTDFEWAWDGQLGSDQGFEVWVWREGEPPGGIHDAVLDNKEGHIQKIDGNKYRLSINIKEMIGLNGLQPRPTGDYLWTVLLVQISPEYRNLGIQATPGHLRFAAGGGDSDGGGGGGAGIN